MTQKNKNAFGGSVVSRSVTSKLTLISVLSCFGAAGLMAQDAPPAAPAPGSNGATDATQTPAPATAGQDMMSAAPPTLAPPKATKNEVSASADFMLGQGTVTLPVGYSLNQSLGGSAGNIVGAFSVPRNSTYYGGTISYSYGQAWYIDLSYEQGQSSGSQSINTGSLGSLASNFTINDTWYQAYVRYTFPSLRGKRFSAYLRAGVSFVQSDLADDASSPAIKRYTQKDTTQDELGNLGFGLGYSLYTSHRLKVGLQLEGEGFFGTRSQDSLETLSADVGVKFVSDTIDNTLYGGIARATVRFEYRLGQSGLFKIFGDLGVQGRYTMIQYPGASAPDEMLYGPYVKVGIRYAF
jgi:hypothetical protein